MLSSVSAEMSRASYLVASLGFNRYEPACTAKVIAADVDERAELMSPCNRIADTLDESACASWQVVEAAQQRNIFMPCMRS